MGPNRSAPGGGRAPDAAVSTDVLASGVAPTQGRGGNAELASLTGARRVAVWVDEFLGERNALLQELGMPCPATGNISAGALLPDGTVFLILNPAGLVATCTPSASVPVPRRAEAPVEAAALGILVVDDSITSRSLEKRILEAHGYRVRVAVDGVEALELLRIENLLARLESIAP